MNRPHSHMKYIETLSIDSSIVYLLAYFIFQIFIISLGISPKIFYENIV